MRGRALLILRGHMVKYHSYSRSLLSRLPLNHMTVLRYVPTGVCSNIRNVSISTSTRGCISSLQIGDAIQTRTVKTKTSISFATSRHDENRPDWIEMKGSPEDLPRANEGSASHTSLLDPKLTGLTRIIPRTCANVVCEMLMALDTKDNEMAWRHFEHIRKAFLTRQLLAQDYAALLISLRPENYISPKNLGNLGESFDAFALSPRAAWQKLRSRLEIVVHTMKMAGHKLGKLEYFHLLDCARAADDRNYVQYVWNEMAGQRNVRPDTWCYNAYMAGICGNPTTEREFRVTPRTLEYRTRTSDDSRSLAFKIYSRMMKKGIAPNSMTIDILIIATARLGDLTTVNTIMQQTWGISEPSVTEAQLQPDSPLYPTQHSLLAVALAFSFNGRGLSAVRLVDQMSTMYKVPISISTWVALLNWTYVFTRCQSRELRQVSSVNRLGQQMLPIDAVQRLWTVMTEPPYSIEPTIEMYDSVIRAFLWRQMPDNAENLMDKAVPIYDRMCNRYESLSQKLVQMIDGEYTSIGVISKLQDRVAYERMQVLRARSIIRRWVELLVLSKQHETYKFSTQRRPNIITKWADFLGRRVLFSTPGGYVDLDLGDRLGWKPQKIRSRKRKSVPLGSGAKEEDYFL